MIRYLAAVFAVAVTLECYGQGLFNNASKGGLTAEGLRTSHRPAGGDYSEIQAGNAATGVSFRRTTFWIADDFQVVASRWRVKKVTVWGFQNGLHYPSVDQGFVEIHRDSQVGPLVALGSWSESQMTDIYRIFTARPEDTYQLQKISFTLDKVLSPGYYWVVFAALGVVNVPGPYSPFLTPTGQLTVPGANAMVRISDTTVYWTPILDPGSFAPLDLAFWIDGDKLPITAQPGAEVQAPSLNPLAPLSCRQ